jgi:branched-chain amino acid transport system permease protein
VTYYVGIATVFAIYAILGVSLNLVVGYAGLLSVCHAAFYGTGAYASAILLTRTGVGFLPALAIGVLVTAGVSLLIGIVLSRFRDDYYALGAFGFNVIVVAVLTNWSGLTNGALGITSIPTPSVAGHDLTGWPYLGIALFALAVVYAVSRVIVGSPFGRVLKAIREDEQAIQVFGYNALKFKLTIFVISAAMASVAGSLLASYVTYVDPTGFDLLESFLILSIIIFGGLANLAGSLVGALVLVVLPELLRFIGFPTELASQMREVIYGLVLILLMLFRPQGLIGEYKI